MTLMNRKYDTSSRPSLPNKYNMEPVYVPVYDALGVYHELKGIDLQSDSSTYLGVSIPKGVKLPGIPSYFDVIPFPDFDDYKGLYIVMRPKHTYITELYDIHSNYGRFTLVWDPKAAKPSDTMEIIDMMWLNPRVRDQFVAVMNKAGGWKTESPAERIALNLSAVDSICKLINDAGGDTYWAPEIQSTSLYRFTHSKYRASDKTIISCMKKWDPVLDPSIHTFWPCEEHDYPCKATAKKNPFANRHIGPNREHKRSDDLRAYLPTETACHPEAWMAFLQYCRPIDSAYRDICNVNRTLKQSFFPTSAAPSGLWEPEIKAEDDLRRFLHPLAREDGYGLKRYSTKVLSLNGSDDPMKWDYICCSWKSSYKGLEGNSVHVKPGGRVLRKPTGDIILPDGENVFHVEPYAQNYMYGTEEMADVLQMRKVHALIEYLTVGHLWQRKDSTGTPGIEISPMQYLAYDLMGLPEMRQFIESCDNTEEAIEFVLSCSRSLGWDVTQYTDHTPGNGDPDLLLKAFRAVCQVMIHVLDNEPQGLFYVVDGTEHLMPEDQIEIQSTLERSWKIRHLFDVSKLNNAYPKNSNIVISEHIRGVNNTADGPELITDNYKAFFDGLQFCNPHSPMYKISHGQNNMLATAFYYSTVIMPHAWKFRFLFAAGYAWHMEMPKDIWNYIAEFLLDACRLDGIVSTPFDIPHARFPYSWSYRMNKHNLGWLDELRTKYQTTNIVSSRMFRHNEYADSRDLLNPHVIIHPDNKNWMFLTTVPVDCCPASEAPAPGEAVEKLGGPRYHMQNSVATCKRFPNWAEGRDIGNLIVKKGLNLYCSEDFDSFVTGYDSEDTLKRKRSFSSSSDEGDWSHKRRRLTL